MESVRDKMASRQSDLKLYLEVFPTEEKNKWTAEYGDEPPIMVFIKHFDVSAQSLTGVGHFYVHKNMRVQDLVPMICERSAIPHGTPLKLYEVGFCSIGLTSVYRRRLIRHPFHRAGDQAEYDRVDEAQGDVSAIGDPGWRHPVFPGGSIRGGVSLHALD